MIPQQIDLNQMYQTRQHICKHCIHRNYVTDKCSQNEKILAIYNKKPNNHCPIGRWQ